MDASLNTVVGQGYRFLMPVEIHDTTAKVSPVTADPVPAAASVLPKVRPWRLQLAVVVTAILVIVCWFGVRRWLQWTPDTAMVAVLPFDEFGGDVSQRYFSQGMTEEIITQLGRTASSGIGVIAGPSIWRYRGTNPTLRQLANDLGVCYVVSGSIRREGLTLRITTRLVRTQDELQIWSESFDGDASGVLALEQDVATSVASAVAAQLRRGVRAKPSPPRPINAAAYDLYLRGRFYWNQRSESSLKQAIDYFRRTIVEAPDYAPA